MIETLDIQNDRPKLIAAYRADVEAFLRLAAPQCEALTRRNPEAWAALEHMPIERLEKLATSFSAYREVCEKDYIKEGWITSVQSAWRLIRKIGLIPPSNLMSMLNETEVIEIYDLDLNQIYRNLNFFSVSSYTFEDLMHRPFAELFGRPDHITNALLGEAASAFSGKRREAFMSSLPVHFGEELRSQKRYVAKIEQRVISPLFNQTGHTLAVLASATIKIIN